MLFLINDKPTVKWIENCNGKNFALQFSMKYEPFKSCFLLSTLSFCSGITRSLKCELGDAVIAREIPSSICESKLSVALFHSLRREN